MQYVASIKAVPFFLTSSSFLLLTFTQAQYSTAPRLVEYTVGLTESLAPVIAAAFPNTAPLNPRVQSNKLAVCLGDGSEYDQHVDNSVYFGQTSEGSSGGVQDLRKLTVSPAQFLLKF